MDIETPLIDEEAEMSVLGSCLISSEAAAEVGEILVPEHFYREGHRRIFRVIQEMARQGQAVDFVTVSSALGQDRDAVGGIAYLAQLAHGVPSPATAVHYARIVKDKYVRRQVAALGMELSLSVKGDSPTEDVLGAAQTALLKLTANEENKGPRFLGDVAAAHWGEVLKQVEAGGGATVGLSTGLSSLDNALGGLRPGDLIVLAGRPAAGKTALAWQMALDAAGTGAPVLGFSLEMSAEQLVERFMSTQGEVDSRMIQARIMSEPQKDKSLGALSKLVRLPVWIDDNRSITLAQIRSRAMGVRARQGALGLVLVDYLQMLTDKSPKASRQEEVAEISRMLKILAGELNVPVLALSQLNRSSEKENRAPRLSDLRESGSIEQDADIVAFLTREHDASDNLTNAVEFIIRKHRHGSVGTIKLTFIPKHMRFGMAAKEDASSEF